MRIERSLLFPTRIGRMLVPLAGLAIVLAPAIHIPTALADPPAQEAQARIELVWPQSDAPVAQADRANVLLYMVRSGGRTLTAICNATPPGMLVALNANPIRRLETGKPVPVTRVAKDGRGFPAWEYQDVDVSAARDSQNRLVFMLSREYIEQASIKTLLSRAWTNAWAHAQDARTFFPHQDVPAAVESIGSKASDPQARSQLPVDIDARIEIVWPHGNVPADQADRANVSAMLFRRGTFNSVQSDFDTTVTLLGGLNQEVLKPVALGQKRVVTAGNLTYPVWDFDNVDVSAARDPRNRYFFTLDVASLQGYNRDGSFFSQTIFGGFSFSNVWVHGTDGRTFFPVQDVPERGCP